tara:strand:- start:294 stop:485 length:192 start_codon:yes stop_codon:yes gene_type:complete
MAIRKDNPTARFLATYSDELKVISETSGPPKKVGFVKAIYGPTNIGQINKNRTSENHQLNLVI